MFVFQSEVSDAKNNRMKELGVVSLDAIPEQVGADVAKLEGNTFCSETSLDDVIEKDVNLYEKIRL